MFYHVRQFFSFSSHSKPPSDPSQGQAKLLSFINCLNFVWNYSVVVPSVVLNIMHVIVLVIFIMTEAIISAITVIIIIPRALQEGEIAYFDFLVGVCLIRFCYGLYYFVYYMVTRKNQSVIDISGENANYRHLGELVYGYGARILRKILRKRLKLLTDLTKLDVNLYDLLMSTKNPKITYANMHSDFKIKLRADINTWDITLLHLVLNGIDFSNGSTEIAAEHQKENNRMKDLKFVRNKYAHSEGTRISGEDFYKWWGIAEDALISLGGSLAIMRDIKKSGIVTKFRHFDLPTPNFTGRKELLKKVHSRIKICSTKESWEERVVVLCGIGGIGKSELARKYAQKYIEDPTVQNVSWIDAENLSSLQASFTLLSNLLLLPTNKKRINEVVGNVYNHFSKNVGSGLFIFDNAEHMSGSPFGIFDYLPTKFLERRPLILITARDKQWDDIPKENIIVIDELDQAESIKLLTKKFQLGKNPGTGNAHYKEYKVAITKLARVLQGYPLSLALATSNIVNATWSDLKKEIDCYLERIEDPNGDWVQDKQTGAATNYKHSMETVWKVTLEKISSDSNYGEGATHLLRLMAYLPPDKMLMKDLERIFLSSFNRKFTAGELGLLEKFSLVSVNRKIEWRHWTNWKSWLDWNVEHVRIHRLVQHRTKQLLNLENDQSYLLHICDHVSQLDLRDHSKEDEEWMLSIHKNLKQENWPQNSISISVILCSQLSFPSGGSEEASLIADDLYDFLDKDIRENTETRAGKDVINLFRLSVFLLKFFKLFRKNKWCNDPNLSRVKLLKLLLTLVSSSIRNRFVSTSSNTSVQKFVSRHCTQLILHMFVLILLIGLLVHGRVNRSPAGALEASTS